MKVVGCLFMLMCWCMIAAWGVVEDDKRRRNRMIIQAFNNAKAIMVQYKHLFQSMYAANLKALESFRQLGLALSKTASRIAYSSEGHIVVIQADGTVFDPSVKNQ